MSKRYVRSLALAAKVFAAAFVALQFVRPGLNNPPATADLSAPPAVKQILRRACYDCHSNETKLLWFDQIVPAYWLVARDVAEGRKRLNFSELGAQPAARQGAALFESVNHVALGAMPPKPYLALHGEARVAEEDLATLKGYLTSLAPRPAPRAPPADAAPPKGAPSGPEAEARRDVAPAPNGIEFPTDYAQWKPVSGTERFDNGSLRAVLGNERAVRAVEEGGVAPWPDGSALAKVAWVGREGEGGVIRAGEFYQVEFMFKDRAKYEKTAGWGWARWRGLGLTPYGRDAGFADECVGCHAPVRDHDFVFTAPIRRAPRGSPGLNEAAALPEIDSVQPLDGQVASVFVDPRASTFSMLLGNDVAIRHARAEASGPFPPGSAFTLITWAGAEDDRWFGARVPGRVARVDTVRLSATQSAEPSWSHQAYEPGRAPSQGSLGRLEPVPDQGPDVARARLRLIEQRALDMPGARRRP